MSPISVDHVTLGFKFIRGQSFVSLPVFVIFLSFWSQYAYFVKNQETQKNKLVKVSGNQFTSILKNKFRASARYYFRWKSDFFFF